MRTWGRDGVPERPGAWLTTVARNRALDRYRRGAVEETKLRIVGAEPLVVEEEEMSDADEFPDDRLRLIFTCCHPALPFDARVALTLRSLTGLTTAEIARAFLVPEQTMAKRLVRAKQKIRNTGIPYRVPPPDLLPVRTPGVLAVLYLLFNEGYSASAGTDLVRQNLCDDAIRLARALVELMQDEPEIRVCSRCSCSSRRAVSPAWTVPAISSRSTSRIAMSGTGSRSPRLRRCSRMHAARDRVGPYQLQAAIASCHAAAAERR